MDAMDNSTAMPLSCFLHFLTISLGKVVISIKLPELGSGIHVFICSSCLHIAAGSGFTFFSCIIYKYYFCCFRELAVYTIKLKKIRFAKPEIFLGFEVQIKRSYILTQQDENSDHKVCRIFFIQLIRYSRKGLSLLVCSVVF